jgi:hypothetical protein
MRQFLAGLCDLRKIVGIASATVRAFGLVDGHVATIDDFVSKRLQALTQPRDAQG